MKAVIHIDEVEKWNLVKANSLNLVKSGMLEDVIIVFNADAVILGLKENRTDFPEGGLSFLFCENSLGQRLIKLSDLDERVSTVPSAAVRIIELQSEGYGYLKP